MDQQRSGHVTGNNVIASNQSVTPGDVQTSVFPEFGKLFVYPSPLPPVEVDQS